MDFPQKLDFSKEKVEVMCNKLNELRYIDCLVLDKWEYAPCGYKTKNEPDDNLVWEEYKDGTSLYGYDKHYWLKTKIKTPKAQEGKELFLSVIIGREGLTDTQNPQSIVYLNGENVQALDTNHTTVKLDYDTEYDLKIYFYTGRLMCDSLFRAKLVYMDEKINKLYYDILVPYNALCCLDEKSYDYIKSLKALDEALIYLDLRDFYSKEFYESIDKCQEILQEEYYKKLCGKNDGIINVIGHTHIDVAWLWSLAQTEEKAQRSFATVINLMNRYPEYKFMSSQPQLYKYVKKNDPVLYEKIKEKIKEGRWLPEGAMWLEADTNLSSGESLIRQLLFGKRFFKEEFGVENRILWLPDVFGYSGALPQILRKSGVDRFFTAKLTWSETNSMPHNTFIWKGIDGSEVFTNFISSYVRNLTPSVFKNAWDDYKDKKYTTEVISTFGYGDGGGGPTQEMLENYKRLKYGLPGFPKAVMEMPDVYFDKAEKEFLDTSKRLKHTPVWQGELYLEMHRGTYTTMAKNKKYNRMSELLYQSLESASLSANILNDLVYPQERINDNWEIILLNQFHDIIPGSSIKEVYEDSHRQYEAVLKNGEEMYNDALNSLKANVNTDGGLFVYNPNAFEFSGIVETEKGSVYVENIPSLGYKVVNPLDVEKTVKAENGIIENSLLKVTFNENGEIVSVYDKEELRECVNDGGVFNRFEVFEDYPRNFDAWEITSYYKQKKWIVDSLNEISYFNEDLKAGIKIKRSYSKSEIWQTISLKHNSKEIEFDTKINWNEDHVLLKTAFDTNIHTTTANCDIQFGHIERPTHENTPWDAAKFEICAHKWVDISEYGYGVSLLNDCKYGYSLENGTIKLSLLKAPTDPNPVADRGEHTFKYVLYPHKGDFRQGGTIEKAYVLNKPLIAQSIEKQTGANKDTFSLISCDKENVVIETVKKAENDNSFIVRLYEAYDSKVNATLISGADIKKAYICDMMENIIEEIEVINNQIRISLKNFEILTLKIEK
ncbi:MAG: alpha-mannosidase [Clostridia bacterium]|nr:alpha-mannosidase [Clostridia bacterium]